MKHGMFEAALIAITLAMSAGLCVADELRPQKAKQVTAADQSKAAAKKGKAPAPAIELVDINSAGKDELKKLPGIGDADADRIIAGRPYLSKAHLVTHNVIPAVTYQGLRQLVVAKQKDSKFAKDVKSKK
jgi:competence protein ComEA